MANTIIELRHSYVTGNVPSSLANGEIAINTYDGKLFYRGSSSNTIQTIERFQGPAGLNGEIQFNDSGVLGSSSGLTFNKSTGTFTAPIVASSNNGNGTNFKVGDDAWIGDINLADTIGIKGQQNSANAYIGFGNNDGVRLGRSGSGPLTYGGSFTANGELSSIQSSGDEGGQINLALAATNTTLSGSIAIDIYQNKFRIFETGGTNRGVYIDIATDAAGGVGTNLLNPTATPDSIARNTANAAFIAANSAGSYANAAFNTANSSSIAANTPSHVANSAAIYANGAFNAANTADAKAVTAGSYANSAFNHANAAFIKANTGGALTVSLTDDSNNFTNVVTSVTGIRFDANSGFDITDLGSGNVKVGMNSTFKTWKITGQSDLIANGLDTIEFVGSNGVVLTSNTLASPKTITFDTSQIFGVANTANTVYVSDAPPNTPKVNTLWWQSNTATLKIYYNDGVTSQWVDTNQTYAVDNVARTSANSAFIHANAAFNAANSAADTWVRNQANSAFIQANAAFTVANAAFTTANGTITWNTANAAFDAANTADSKAVSSGSYANSAFISANSAGVYANGAFAAANNEAGVNVTQNNSIAAAFTRANNSLSANSGGTVTGSVVVVGDFAVTGNITITGNTITQNVTTLNISDPLIYLAANNYSSDIVEIGFAANYYDGSNNRHTGFFREASNKEYYVFDNYLPEPDSNLIDINDASFRVATLHANIVSTIATIGGVDIKTYVDNAFNAANAATATDATQNNSITAAFIAANSSGNYANAAFNAANSNYTSAVTKLDVTNSGASAYLIDQYSGNNPTIYVRAGETIAFNLNVTGHPFLIRESNGGANTSAGLIHVSTTGVVSTGSSAQGQVTGVLYWKVPFDIVGSTYVYQCGIHGGMVGNIVIEQPTILAFNQANASFNIANSAAIAANTPSHVANSAAIYANGAFFAANTEAAVNATQNTTIQLAWNHANSAYNQANNGGASVSVGDDPPAAPTANSLWWQSNTGELKIYYNDGTSSQWVDAFSSAYSLDQWARDQANAAFNQANTGGGASVSVSDSPPSSPAANSLWWQSNTGVLKIYYNDGTSSQWVDSSTSTYSLDQAARNIANSAYNHANAAFNAANTGGGGGGTPVTVSTFQETANGTVSSFDLGFSPASGQILIVSIDGVVQPVTTYTVDPSANSISFTTGPLSGEVVYVVGFSNTSAYVINDGSVTYAKLSSSAISTIEGNAIALSIALG